MIELCNIGKIYPPKQTALVNVDLKIQKGDFLFIAGASGAGKSTLLKLLFAAERSTTGDVLVEGRSIQTLDSNGIAELRRDIGVIFQDYKLLKRSTVVDNVAFGLEVRGVSKKARRNIAAELLDAIGLGDRLESYPAMLSGGEQQRVAIARALICKPKYILADEPTGNLDAQMTKVVFDLLLEANKMGVTIIVATHDLAMIEELNLRTIVLDKGKIIGDFDNPRGA